MQRIIVCPPSSLNDNKSGAAGSRDYGAPIAVFDKQMIGTRPDRITIFGEIARFNQRNKRGALALTKRCFHRISTRDQSPRDRLITLTGSPEHIGILCQRSNRLLICNAPCLQIAIHAARHRISAWRYISAVRW